MCTNSYVPVPKSFWCQAVFDLRIILFTAWTSVKKSKRGFVQWIGKLLNDFKIYKTVTVWTPLTVSQPYLATCLYQTRDEAFLCRLAHQGTICPDDDDKKSMCVVNFMAINEDLSGRDLSHSTPARVSVIIPLWSDRDIIWWFKSQRSRRVYANQSIRDCHKR